MAARTIAVALLCVTMFATAPVANGETSPSEETVEADVTLRVAPEGFVIPSLHWTTSWITGESTEAVWLIDPVEDDRFDDQDGVAGCADLSVPDGNGDGRVDGGEVLDHATETGCISGWDYYIDDDWGRFLTEIDGREKAGPTQTGWPAGWWKIQLDGESSPVGIDHMDLEDGQSLSFVYMLHA